MMVLGIHAEVWLGLFAASQWVIRAGALLVVPFRRSPEAAKGWLLLFTVAPWPALLVYAFIGRARHPKWRRERVAKLPAMIWDALIDAREARLIAEDCGNPCGFRPTLRTAGLRCRGAGFR